MSDLMPHTPAHSASAGTTRRPTTGRTARRLAGAVLGTGALLAVGAAPALAAPSGAAVVSKAIYMVTFAGNSTLNRVSPTNGARTLVGSTGVQLTDVAFRGSTLNAVSFSRLYTLNPNTGRATTVGALGFADINALVAAPNGQLYAAGSNAPGRFVTINATTGRARQIGSFGAGLSSAGDLAYLNGVLYATVNRGGYRDTFLARINPVTGHATLIGDNGLPGVWGLTVRTGVLYGATNSGVVVRLSPATGRATRIGVNGVNQAGLATAP